jgi:hypothetical protein
MSEQLCQKLVEEIEGTLQVYERKDQLNDIEYGRFKQLRKLKTMIEIEKEGEASK